MTDFEQFAREKCPEDPSGTGRDEGGFVKTDDAGIDGHMAIERRPKRVVHLTLFKDQSEWARDLRWNLSDLIRRLLDQEFQRINDELKKGLVKELAKPRAVKP